MCCTGVLYRGVVVIYRLSFINLSTHCDHLFTPWLTVNQLRLALLSLPRYTYLSRLQRVYLPQELFCKGRSWRRVDYAPNKRRGVDESAIWDHSTDYVAADNDKLHAWRCLYCHKTHLNIMKHEATSNALRHLRVTHGIGLGSTQKRKRVEEDSDVEE